MASRVVVTLLLLCVFSVWVPSAKALPHGKEAAPVGNERCNRCPDLIKTGAAPDDLLRAVNGNAEPSSDEASLKAEDVKRAEAQFLEYCRLNCKALAKASEKENLTKPAGGEFGTAVESSTADSGPGSSERTKLEQRLLDGDSDDAASPTKSPRFLSYLQNQILSYGYGDNEKPKPDPEEPKLDTGNPNLDTGNPKPDTEKPEPGTEKPEPGTEKPEPGTEKPEPGTEKPEPGTEKPEPGTEKPEPGTEKPEPDTEKPDSNTDASSTAEVFSTTTVESNLTDTPTFSTPGLSTTTSRMTETTAEMITTTATSLPTTSPTDPPTGQTEKPACNADNSDSKGSTTPSNKIIPYENAVELLFKSLLTLDDLVSCLIEVILTDVGLTMDMSFGLFRRTQCGNVSAPKTVLTVEDYSTQTYLKQLTELMKTEAEGIIAELEAISLQSDFAAGNDEAGQAHDHAGGFSDLFRISKMKDIFSSPETVEAVREYLQRRQLTAEQAK